MEQRGLAEPLQESDRDGNVSGTTAEGILWEFTPSLMQQSLPTLPGRKRRGQCLLLNPEAHPGLGALLLNAGPEGDAQTGRGTGLEGVSSAMFWKATSAERQPSDLMDGFSFQIVNAFTRSHQLTGNCLLKIFHSILSHHIPSNSQLFGQNRFVKKIKIIFVASSLFFIE